jgi:hypothetical protein
MLATAPAPAQAGRACKDQRAVARSPRPQSCTQHRAIKRSEAVRITPGIDQKCVRVSVVGAASCRPMLQSLLDFGCNHPEIPSDAVRLSPPMPVEQTYTQAIGPVENPGSLSGESRVWLSWHAVCIVHMPGVGHALLCNYKKVARRAALIPGTFVTRAPSLWRSSPSVLYGDRVWPKTLAACARKQRKGASGDERQRAVGRIDRKHLDLIVDIVQRI